MIGLIATALTFATISVSQAIGILVVALLIAAAGLYVVALRILDGLQGRGWVGI